MNPRNLRSAIQRGEVTAVNPKLYKGRTPEPPPEWPEWRRRLLRVAIHAALFFLKGKKWQEISRDLERNGVLDQKRRDKSGEVVSKARVQQYVDKGVQFLIQRGCFVNTVANGSKTREN